MAGRSNLPTGNHQLSWWLQPIVARNMQITDMKLLLLPLLYLMTACNYAEDSDISKITLINDLGGTAKISLCKGDPHCVSLEEIWVPKILDAHKTISTTVTNDVKTIFHVSSVTDGKIKESCLRLHLDHPHKATQDVLLSSATDC